MSCCLIAACASANLSAPPGLADDTQQGVPLPGEVTYQVEKLGMGIRFSELSPDDRMRIEAYVAKSAAPADPTGMPLSA